MRSSWVTGRTGLQLRVSLAQSSQSGQDWLDCLELGLRRNPKRAHLLVSRLLAKHIPVPVSRVLGSARDLGTLVAQATGQAPLVLGFAETATGLGHGVAAHLPGEWWSAHTTRRPLPAGVRVLEFTEDHSHAVQQTLAVTEDPAWTDGRPVVLVDDEISTGNTSVNAIRALQEHCPRAEYVIATLVDSRSPEQREWCAREVANLGARVRDVCLVRAQLQVPADLQAVAAEAVATVGAPAPLPPGPLARLNVSSLRAGVPLSGALGWDREADSLLRCALSGGARGLDLPPTGRTLVLGDEESLWPAQLLAEAIGPQVRTSSTTRSPALVLDEDGYPLRTAAVFAATDDPGRTSYAYNVAASRHPDRGNAPGFDDIVLVLDQEPGQHTWDGLVTQLRRAAARAVHVVVLAP
jgi:adenine/guanine phosphoribosyltransferase-like PRPP-binding protein